MVLSYRLFVNGDNNTGVSYYHVTGGMMDGSQLIMEVRERIKQKKYIPSNLYTLVKYESEHHPLTCMLTGFTEYDNPQDANKALDVLLFAHLHNPELNFNTCINLVDIKEHMRRLRYSLTVHSGLYYDHNVNVISDSDWDARALKLVELQRRYPGLVDKVEFFDDIFRDFTGDTGMHLPWRDPGMTDKIYSLGKQWGVL